MITDREDDDTREMDLHFIRTLPQGKYRRKFIIRFFEREPNEYYHMNVLPVNRKWQIQTKGDKDIKKLMRKGYLKFHRSSIGNNAKQTYLVKA